MGNLDSLFRQYAAQQPEALDLTATPEPYVNYSGALHVMALPKQDRDFISRNIVLKLLPEMQRMHEKANQLMGLELPFPSIILVDAPADKASPAAHSYIRQHNSIILVRDLLLMDPLAQTLSAVGHEIGHFYLPPQFYVFSSDRFPEECAADFISAELTQNRSALEDALNRGVKDDSHPAPAVRIEAVRAAQAIGVQLSRHGMLKNPQGEEVQFDASCKIVKKPTEPNRGQG